MKHLFVPYGLAVKLKEKGFKEECMAYYEYALKSRKDKEQGYSGSFGWKKGECNFNKGYMINESKQDTSNDYWNIVAAPLYQQVIDWFGQVHGIYVGYQLHYDLDRDSRGGDMYFDGFSYFICPIDKEGKLQPLGKVGIPKFTSIPEAYQRGIEEALKLIQLT
jgi:hypothetical protein